MKKILLAMAMIVAATSAQADCFTKIADYAKDDKMIAAWAKDSNTGDTVVVVNNIRNMKAIDITNYGFDKSMAKSMDTKWGCQNTKFVDGYDSYGIPKFNFMVKK